MRQSPAAAAEAARRRYSSALTVGSVPTSPDPCPVRATARANPVRRTTSTTTRATTTSATTQNHSDGPVSPTEPRRSITQRDAPLQQPGLVLGVHRVAQLGLDPVAGGRLVRDDGHARRHEQEQRAHCDAARASSTSRPSRRIRWSTYSSVPTPAWNG